ncbi:MAG: zinc ribbon domain-containing protein [Candidatus Bathyarchaeota archaeon]|nr:MAG: zinc ribbon domain-containing protein [Candidatus Bathyarchaeota archaeon]
MSVIQEIRCSKCGAPIAFNPGEIIATCTYCGYTGVVETGKAFTLEHSMILNNYEPEQMEELVRNWMQSGFMKPGNLAKASKILEKKLVYLPFWVVPVTASSQYKGVFERLVPPVVKDGKIEKKYDWLVLGRKAAKFPTKEYDIPLEGKIPYDFRKIQGFAKVLNSEVEEAEAVETAKQQIEEHHQFLAKQDVDRLVEMKTDFSIGDPVYLHAPIWFVIYEYKDERHEIIIGGGEGVVIRGDIPTTKFGLF